MHGVKDPRRLWRRYALAIVLILALLTGSHAVLISALHSGGENATAINIAGRQRMLSQRIMFFASRDMQRSVGEAPDPRLIDAIYLFEDSHAALSGSGSMGLSVAGAEHRAPTYFTLPDGETETLDDLVREFLAQVRQVLNPAHPDRDAAWNRLFELGSGHFLQRLDGAVRTFERNSLERTNELERLALLSFGIALLVMLGEALFIFLPAHRSVVRSISGMQDAIDKLTETHAAERSARRRAERAERAKDQFLSHMSHELRTPLNGMIGMLELLGADTDKATADERLLFARQSANHLLTICNDVLDLSKLDAGKLSIDRAPMSPTDLGRAVHFTFAKQAQDKGIALRVTEHPGLPDHILVDDTRLRQVVFNLVSNAVKFTDTGTVDMVVSHVDDHLAVEVRDTGPGIADADRDRLFESFEQLDASTSRRYGGTGLGLAITRRLITAMEGRIDLAANPAGGSIFRVAIPATPASPAALAGDTGARPSPAPASLKGLRALVAEDNRVNQKVMAAMLDRLEVDFVMVENGAEAVTAARSDDFDVLLIDIQMPVLDGFGAARQIRSLPPPHGAVPMLSVSANVSNADKQRAKAAGFDGSVGKPVGIEPLRHHIGALCGDASASAGSLRQSA